MQILTMGANAPLHCDDVAVTLRWPTASGVLDASIYMLGANGRVRGDHDMVFYNQPSDPDRAVHISSIAIDSTEVRIDLTRVSNLIDRIVICVTVEHPDQTMAKFVGTSVDIDGGGKERFVFEPVLLQAKEVAMRMVEFYRRDGRWRIRAIGQGFNAGLGALARSFGVDIGGEEHSPNTTSPSVDSPQGPKAASQPEPQLIDHLPVAEPAIGDVGKVHENNSPSVMPDLPGAQPLTPILPEGNHHLSITRPEHAWPLPDSDFCAGLTVELIWQSRLGGAHGRARYLELELGCFYEAVDGTRGILQCWDARGHIDRAPFIRLEDAKMVDGVGHQTLAIADQHRAKIKHLQLYAFIPNGSANWAMASVAMTTTLGDYTPVSMTIENGKDGQAIVAMMTIDQSQQSIVATHQARFAPRHPDLDILFGWGMTWKTRPSPYNIR